MPGVLRPYTLIDVLATINDQAAQGQVSATALTAPLSSVAEADEQATATDAVSGQARSAAGWDQEIWGATAWA